jgi:hypothetical protein
MPDKTDNVSPDAPPVDPGAAARALGSKGGRARAKNLSAKRRSEIASAAGRARHGLKPKPAKRRKR